MHVFSMAYPSSKLRNLLGPQINVMCFTTPSSRVCLEQERLASLGELNRVGERYILTKS
jgi:hypothetical protein